MIGHQLQGQVVEFQGTSDPPGAWAFTVGDLVLAELSWSREERAVRIELAEEVWRARFSRGRVFGGVIESAVGAPLLLYGGGLASGFALSRAGAQYELFVASDWRRGLWTGIDDVEGDAVLRATSQLGRGGLRSEVALSYQPGHRSDLEALLLLWGALRVLRQRRPFGRILRFPTSRRASERALGRMLESIR